MKSLLTLFIVSTTGFSGTVPALPAIGDDPVLPMFPRTIPKEFFSTFEPELQELLYQYYLSDNEVRDALNELPPDAVRLTQSYDFPYIRDHIQELGFERSPGFALADNPAVRFAKAAIANADAEDAVRRAASKAAIPKGEAAAALVNNAKHELSSELARVRQRTLGKCTNCVTAISPDSEKAMAAFRKNRPLDLAMSLFARSKRYSDDVIKRLIAAMEELKEKLSSSSGLTKDDLKAIHRKIHEGTDEIDPKEIGVIRSAGTPEVLSSGSFPFLAWEIPANPRWKELGYSSPAQEYIDRLRLDSPHLSVTTTMTVLESEGGEPVVRAWIQYAGSAKVPDLLDNLVAAINRGPNKGEEVACWAARMYHEFITIHPFPNGNRKVGIALLNAMLEKHGHNWAAILDPDMFHGSSTSQRIQAIKQGMEEFRRQALKGQ